MFWREYAALADTETKTKRTSKKCKPAKQTQVSVSQGPTSGRRVESERRKLRIGRRKHCRWQIEPSAEQRFDCSKALEIRNLLEATRRENGERLVMSAW